MTISANVSTPSTNKTMLIQYMKIVGHVMKGYGFVIEKHEIPHFSQWPPKHFAQYHVKQSSPNHVHNEEGGSP
jgi:hypothetical protein